MLPPTSLKAAQLSSMRLRAKQTQLSRPVLNSRLCSFTLTKEVVASHKLCYLLVLTSSEGEFIIPQHHSPTYYSAERGPILIAKMKPDSFSSITKENVEI